MGDTQLLQTVFVAHRQIRVDFGLKKIRYHDMHKKIPGESVDLVVHNHKIQYALFNTVFHA